MASYPDGTQRLARRAGPVRRRGLEPLDPGLDRGAAVAHVASQPHMRDPAGTCLGIDPGPSHAKEGRDFVGGEERISTPVAVDLVADLLADCHDFGCTDGAPGFQDPLPGAAKA